MQHVSSGVVAHSLSCPAACGIFPDQESNLCPLHWQADSQPLDYQGSPVLLYFFFFFFRVSLVHIFFFLLLLKISNENFNGKNIILHNYSSPCVFQLFMVFLPHYFGYHTVIFSRRQEFSLYAFYTRNSSVLEIVLMLIHQDKGKFDGGY